MSPKSDNWETENRELAKDLERMFNDAALSYLWWRQNEMAHDYRRCNPMVERAEAFVKRYIDRITWQPSDPVKFELKEELVEEFRAIRDEALKEAEVLEFKTLVRKKSQ